MADLTVEKISDTEAKIITPQPDKEETKSVEMIKTAISQHESDILFHQGKIAELQSLLAEFEKVGIDTKLTEVAG